MEELKVTLSPEEAKAFARRIDELEKALLDLEDGELNTLLPAEFADCLSFDASNGVLKINNGVSGGVVFEPEEMPIAFRQDTHFSIDKNHAHSLIIEYTNPETNKRETLHWAFERLNGKVGISPLDDVSKKLMGENGIQFDELRQRNSPPVDKLARKLEEYNPTGNFLNNLAKINEMYNESTPLNGIHAPELNQIYEQFIAQHPQEIKKAPPIQQPEVYRRIAFLKQEEIFTLVGHGGVTMFNADTLDLAEEALAYCKKSLKAFQPLDGTDFDKINFDKLKHIIQSIEGKLTPPSGGKYDTSEHFEPKRLGKILREAERLQRLEKRRARKMNRENSVV